MSGWSSIRVTAGHRASCMPPGTGTIDLWLKPHILVRDHHDVLAQPSFSSDDARCRRTGPRGRSHSRAGAGAGASARSAAGADRPREHAAANGSRWRRPGAGPRRQPGIATATADHDAAGVSARAGAAPGQPIFAAQCGFCHGRDAMGGETGPDLTRVGARRRRTCAATRSGRSSATGRPDKGMPRVQSAATPTSPPSSRSSTTRRSKAAVADRRPPRRGRRRSADRQRRGGAAVSSTAPAVREVPFADRRFRRARDTPAGARAAAAHALSGRTRARRRGAGGHGRDVTLPSGETVTGTLAYRDEFTIALTDATGWYRVWPTSQVKFTVDDPLAGARRAAGEIHR